MRILFQGDSITDAGRDKRNYHQMGNGYPKYAVQEITAAFPDVDFEFINLGISGNRAGLLFDRIYPDGIALEPDIISILIGINDLWHRYYPTQVATTYEQFEVNYRSILERLKRETNAKIVMMAPFLLDCDDKEAIREDLKTLLPIVRTLADRYADAYIPLDELFGEALKTEPERMYYSGDGIHPNQNGAEFIGKQYAKYVKPLIEAGLK